MFYTLPTLCIWPACMSLNKLRLLTYTLYIQREKDAWWGDKVTGTTERGEEGIQESLLL